MMKSTSISEVDMVVRQQKSLNFYQNTYVELNRVISGREGHLKQMTSSHRKNPWPRDKYYKEIVWEDDIPEIKIMLIWPIYDKPEVKQAIQNIWSFWFQKYKLGDNSSASEKLYNQITKSRKFWINKQFEAWKTEEVGNPFLREISQFIYPLRTILHERSNGLGIYTILYSLVIHGNINNNWAIVITKHTQNNAKYSKFINNQTIRDLQEYLKIALKIKREFQKLSTLELMSQVKIGDFSKFPIGEYSDNMSQMWKIINCNRTGRMKELYQDYFKRYGSYYSDDQTLNTVVKYISKELDQAGIQNSYHPWLFAQFKHIFQKGVESWVLKAQAELN